jgi:gluconate:H+ symporter, GntP family
LVFQKRTDPRKLSAGMQSALASAGVVILIIAAGGAFGAALEQSGVGTRFQEIAEQYSIGALPLAFVVTVVIRTAQGSATVAMITAAGILKGFAADPAALGFHPVYLALAVGCGSKPFPWMNDAGFWLIGRTAGLTESETLKTSSTMISVMGCVGMAAVLAMAWLFPTFGAAPYAGN